jgi:hypothetical protein
MSAYVRPHLDGLLAVVADKANRRSGGRATPRSQPVGSPGRCDRGFRIVASRQRSRARPECL